MASPPGLPRRRAYQAASGQRHWLDHDQAVSGRASSPRPGPSALTVTAGWWGDRHGRRGASGALAVRDGGPSLAAAAGGSGRHGLGQSKRAHTVRPSWSPSRPQSSARVRRTSSPWPRAAPHGPLTARKTNKCMKTIEAQDRDTCPGRAFVRGAGDENRTRTISLGSSAVTAARCAEQASLAVPSDPGWPLVTPANGTLMARRPFKPSVVTTNPAPRSFPPVLAVHLLSGFAPHCWF